MSKNKNLLEILLAVITGVAMLSAMLVRAFFPAIILPRLNSLALIALSLLALGSDHYIAGGSRRKYWFIPLCGALIFGLFPWISCFVMPLQALKLALMGAVIFTACTFIFDCMLKRLTVGKASKVAPIISALGLYLAAQCLMGII